MTGNHCSGAGCIPRKIFSLSAFLFTSHSSIEAWRRPYYYEFSQPPEYYLHRELYQFLRIFRTQMAARLSKLLDPYRTAPSFFRFRFPSSDAPAPAPLPSTHHRQQVHLLVWCNSPGEARTVPIFKRPEIINFVVSAYRRDRRPHRSIKTRSNDTKSNMK